MRALALLLGLALLAPAAALPARAGVDTPPQAGLRAAAGEATVAPGERFTALVRLDGAPRVQVVATHARVTGVPDGCEVAPVHLRRSSVSMDGSTLDCVVRPGATWLDVPLQVRGVDGDSVAVELVTPSGRSLVEERRVAGAAVDDPRRLRLLSSPDFLNADVGDLRRGPTRWSPRRTENSVNRSYRVALDRVLDDWERADPAAVLVAGDLVEGHWGVDSTRSGNFGPVRSVAERRAALRRAAATYYPQWLERFERRGLDVRPAMGDHEYGDNPWPRAKRRLAPDYERAFAARFTRRGNGTPRYADRPRRSVHEHTAYAWRPSPDVQVVTLNVFDSTRRGMRMRVDRPQLRWLQQVLARAQRDQVRWVVVQGHTPILGPVRTRASSALGYEGGHRSPLWRTFVRYGVDLYLCGEVHQVTASERDGVTQVAHGGLFPYGLTNYLLADFHDDRVELALRDYDATWRDARNGSRLWQTRNDGLPKVIEVDPEPYVTGTAVLRDGAGLTEPTGVLLPVPVSTTSR